MRLFLMLHMHVQELRPGRPYRRHFRRWRPHFNHGWFHRHDGCRFASTPHIHTAADSYNFLVQARPVCCCAACSSTVLACESRCPLISTHANSVLKRKDHCVCQERWRARLDLRLQLRLPVGPCFLLICFPALLGDL
jgi:hypothetical protein